jgi:hypothetical protein
MTDRRVRLLDRAARTQRRARSRTLVHRELLLDMIAVCRRMQGRFQARVQDRRVDRRLLEEKLPAIMLDAARIQQKSNSDRTTTLRGMAR